MMMMKHFARHLALTPIATVAAAALIGLALPLAPAPAWAQAAASQPAGARKEVALPLQAAQELIRAGKGAEALVRIAEAEAVPALTPYESYIIQRNKAPAALGAGDLPLAIKGFEASMESPLLPAADRLPIIDVLARVSYQSKDYPRAVKWLKRYAEEGGKDPQTRALLTNALYLTDDHAGVVKELAPQVQADAQAGRTTDDVLLRMLAGSQRKVGDAAGYRGTLERIAVQGGKAEVWTELIGLSMQAANMGDRYKLDYYRLRQATAGLESADEFLEMAFLAQQAGLPGEADAVLKSGDARGMFASGAAAQQAKQLKQQVVKSLDQDRKSTAASETSAQAAKDGNALFGLGLALSGDGQADKGLALMTQGLAKGGLRRPDQAMLHLGIAQWRAGRIDDAVKSFGEVRGGEGGPELARLWQAFVRSKGGAKS
jgi:hypothetical protein